MSVNIKFFNILDLSPSLYPLINKYFREFLATKAQFSHLCQFTKISVTINITDFFHSNYRISYHFHMKTLFPYYQYYKTLFLLIISRIMSFHFYYIISTHFIYVFLFFANKMQTMFTFIYFFIIKMPRWQRT